MKKTSSTIFYTATPSTSTHQKPAYRKSKQQLTTLTPSHTRATFTYIGKETTFITNIFRRTKLKIAFRTNNTIQNLLKHKIQKSDKYASSGAYKIKCLDCKKAYVGQTGRSFSIRYNEHKLAFRKNSHTLKFAQHLTDHVHSFGIVHGTMQILQYLEKSAHLNTLERCYIHAEYADNNHLNDKHRISQCYF